MTTYALLKQNDSYGLIDVRKHQLAGSYQIIEYVDHFPHWRTCGVYFTKKDALKDFNAMSRKKDND